jgi:hypothetical protein
LVSLPKARLVRLMDKEKVIELCHRPFGLSIC